MLNYIILQVICIIVGIVVGARLCHAILLFVVDDGFVALRLRLRARGYKHVGQRLFFFSPSLFFMQFLSYFNRLNSRRARYI